MKWIDAGKADEILDNTMIEVDTGATAILLVKSNREFFAVSAVCPHHQAWFIQGRVDGTSLHCPRHMGAFDMKSGRLLSGPSCGDLPCYPVRIENGKVLIKSE